MNLALKGLAACNICWRCGRCVGSACVTITGGESMDIWDGVPRCSCRMDGKVSISPSCKYWCQLGWFTRKGRKWSYGKSQGFSTNSNPPLTSSIRPRSQGSKDATLETQYNSKAHCWYQSRNRNLVSREASSS